MLFMIKINKKHSPAPYLRKDCTQLQLNRKLKKKHEKTCHFAVFSNLPLVCCDSNRTWRAIFYMENVNDTKTISLVLPDSTSIARFNFTKIPF